jgi:putative transposase
LCFLFFSYLRFIFSLSASCYTLDEDRSRHMLRDAPFAINEAYHVYNRGAHKQDIFTDSSDYQRFLFLLFIMNDTKGVRIDRILSGRGLSSSVFVEEKPTKSLVDILSYALMPNHFHIVVRQKTEQGVSKFFKKVLTGYSMYFNTKYEHSGVLFQGPFKSRYIDNEAYFRWIFSYVHLNPLSIWESGWEEGGIKDIEGAKKFMNSYEYSSYLDYAGVKRPESEILSTIDIPDFLNKQNDFEDLLRQVDEDCPRH